jgi:N6-adenosine-specific RNA methylase IME4
MLPEALEVMKSLGFTYKTSLFWHKTGRMGLGYWFRGEVEILLFGIKGKVKAFKCQLPNHVEAPVGEHSEKPEIFREIIEKATANMSPRYLELFARKEVPGWRCLGRDIDNRDIRDSLASLGEVSI